MLDRTGIKFGRLEAIRFSKKVGNRWLWECKCECGKILLVSTSHMNKITKVNLEAEALKKELDKAKAEIVFLRTGLMMVSMGITGTYKKLAENYVTESKERYP